MYTSEYKPTVETPLAFLGRSPWQRIKDFPTASVALVPFTLFPFQKEIKDEWFSLPSTDRRSQAVQVINVTCNRAGRIVRRGRSYASQHGIDNFPQSLSNDDYEIFFHGTSHSSAEDIVIHGIDLNRGEKKKDFSDGDGGFYLCEDFEVASREIWADNRPPCSAVLVFRVARADFRGTRLGLNLADDIERWKEVVRHFRLGLRSREFLKTLDGYDFIEGPLAGGGQSFSNPFPNDDSYQLCIKSKDCARLFDRSLHSAVFFEH